MEKEKEVFQKFRKNDKSFYKTIKITTNKFNYLFYAYLSRFDLYFIFIFKKN